MLSSFLLSFFLTHLNSFPTLFAMPSHVPRTIVQVEIPFMPAKLYSHCQTHSSTEKQHNTSGPMLKSHSSVHQSDKKQVHTSTTKRAVIKEKEEDDIGGRMIMCSKNDEVHQINTLITESIPGTTWQLHSINSIVTDSGPCETLHDMITPEFLHGLDSSSISPHLLTLKVGCSVIIL